MKLHPYLNFNGNCGEAFQCYAKVLNGKDLRIMTFADAPPGTPIPPEAKAQVMHARFTVGGDTIMGSDVPPERHKPMRSVYLSLSVSGAEEAEHIFSVLSEGGEVFMPLQETFWAVRFATLRDKFGTLWMINADRPTS